MKGLRIYPDYLSVNEQMVLLNEIIHALSIAPFFTPTLPRWGTPFSVQMTNLGSLGWVSDKSGYRYQPLHPETQKPWPAMPERVMNIWHDLADYPKPPEACLVNYYRPNAKMGLHQDKDEKDMDAPVLSISLGDTALFRIGGIKRDDPTKSLKLSSGDVLVLGGDSRMLYHGIDRLYPNTSSLFEKSDIKAKGIEHLKEGGRINLTLRRVNV